MKISKLFLVLIVLCITFSVYAQNSYTRAELWQKEVDDFLAADKKQFPPKNAVLFYGSSSFRMWKEVDKAFPKYKIINRGFGGTHFEDAIYYAKDIVIPYKPKLVVLYEGDNDITAGKSVEQVFNDYKTLVGIIHKALPKTRIVFVSIKPSPSREKFWDEFKYLNSLVKAETQIDKRLEYVDIWDAMLDANGKGREELYLQDKLHMNHAGYEIWRKALEPVIAKGVKGNFR